MQVFTEVVEALLELWCRCQEIRAHLETINVLWDLPGTLGLLLIFSALEPCCIKRVIIILQFDSQQQGSCGFLFDLCPYEARQESVSIWPRKIFGGILVGLVHEDHGKPNMQHKNPHKSTIVLIPVI